MKKYLYLFVLSLASFGAKAQGTVGLVAHWNFNGTANDVSGNGLNGTVYGASLATGYNTVANNAYSFKGFNTSLGEYEHIDIAYDAAMDVQNFSICTFIQIDSFSDDLCNSSALLWRGTQGSSSYYSLALNDNVTDNSCFIFSPTETNYVGEVGDLAWGVSPLARGYSNYAVADTWTCVVETFDGDSMKTYINGVLSNSLYYPYATTPGNQGIRIGASTNGITGPGMWSYPFFGTIDDMKLYGRALTPADVDMYCEEARRTNGGGDTTNHGGDTTTPTRIQVINSSLDFALSPNPASDIVNVRLQGNKPGNVQLLNSVGQLVAQKPIESGIVSFKLEGYAPGMYVLRVQLNNGQTALKKFIKQ
ncbi:MAG: T9SS type A sorting domain-containing protein [Sphingobacteriales bacterium]|nr:MAG: T9SS type A sorting domain-containing protein [Sphingobacteriales bacterium]